MENDTIYRQDAIDAVKHAWAKGLEPTQYIEDLPSAQPEIIRCKECKYWREYKYVNGRPKFLPRCGFHQIYVREDDFCSAAERRTDE